MASCGSLLSQSCRIFIVYQKSYFIKNSVAILCFSLPLQYFLRLETLVLLGRKIGIGLRFSIIAQTYNYQTLGFTVRLRLIVKHYRPSEWADTGQQAHAHSHVSLNTSCFQPSLRQLAYLSSYSTTLQLGLCRSVVYSLSTEMSVSSLTFACCMIGMVTIHTYSCYLLHRIVCNHCRPGLILC